MERSRVHWVWSLAFLVLGCSAQRAVVKEAVAGSPKAPAAAAPKEEKPLARVSDRPGNPSGKVLIVEYHNLLMKESRWVRSLDNFRKDLERMYKMGFRPVTVSEYLSGKMNLAPGASPMVFTFDDADDTQFKMKPDGSVDPECAVGIWQEFAKQHPDFPIKATFYVLPNMWSQPKWVDKKIEMLKGWGSELGSHTITHPKLNHLSDEQVKKEFADAIDYLASKGFTDVSLALPFGLSPKNKSLLREFDYKGKHYAMKAAMLVGSNPAPPVTDPKFDAYRIPRIQGIDGDYGITYWLDQVAKGQVKPYVEP